MAPSSGDHLFTCGVILWPQQRESPTEKRCSKACILNETSTVCKILDRSCRKSCM